MSHSDQPPEAQAGPLEALVSCLRLGMDIDCRVKLFRADGDETRFVTNREWVRILDLLGASMGEMVCLRLYRDSGN